MRKYVVKRTEMPKLLISKVAIECTEGNMVGTIQYSHSARDALKFEVADEANSLITFIGDVIDWEAEQNLELADIEI